MKMRGTIQAGRVDRAKHNCLSISMVGDQNYVKIYDDRGQLLQENKTPGALIVEQIAEPGTYVVESDGRIDQIRSINHELGD